VSLNATFLFQMIVFFLLGWFTMKFVWPPLVKAIDERARKIADGLAAAEKGRADLASAEKRVADAIAEARGKAAEIIAHSEKRAAQIVDEAREAAKGEGQKMLAAARADIEQEVAKAKDALRHQVADLAVAGARRILQREVDAKAHADLLAGLTREL
jgi:F-type H+-transporting ATPase subunit b